MQEGGFSLVEVVLALGVIAFAVVAILGVIPTGLKTSHNAQDETRVAQIAQTLFAAMASQAQTQFTAVNLPIASSAPLDLSQNSTTSPAAFVYANNDGILSQPSAGDTFSVSIFADNTVSPALVEPGSSIQVTLRIVSPPLPNSAATPNPDQSVRDYVRIVSA